jgi:hypothetical protein
LNSRNDYHREMRELDKEDNPQSWHDPNPKHDPVPVPAA